MMLTMALAATVMGSAALPKLSVRGIDMVDPSGKRVLLKGCNLGNWLTMESWMLCLTDAPNNFRDQYEFEEILTNRFGEAEKDRLMDLYRSNWIRERDFPIIRSFGFNVVRLPMNYRLMEDDRQPMRLKKNAWRWIDQAVDMAERNGLYTILDMHGAQGGQSVYDHTGHSGQNKIWTEPKAQERLAWLWGEVAKRYRNRTAVVAYDVFNEPYGGTHEGQKSVFAKALASIRRYDSQKLVYAHGHYDGFAHYGKGMPNVGFQMHYYPGLFGNGNPTLLTHARHLQSIETKIAPEVASFNAPFLIGEMNVVFKRAGGAAMMRRYYDVHARHGWATTMWSYKALSREGGIGDATWGMVTNRKPARLIDIRTASKADIEGWMRDLGTQEYEVYEELRQALTAKTAPALSLPEIPKPVASVPYQDAIPGWTATDLNGSLKGGLRSLGDGAFTLYGGGSDIWGGQDQARFLHREVTGDFTLEVTVAELPPLEQYSKAGLMVRESLEKDAAATLLSTFPDGGVQLAHRAAKGGQMEGVGEASGDFPIRMRLVRQGDELTAYAAAGREPMQVVGKVRVSARTLQVGPVALSHDNGELIGVKYQGLQLRNSSPL